MRFERTLLFSYMGVITAFFIFVLVKHSAANEPSKAVSLLLTFSLSALLSYYLSRL